MSVGKAPLRLRLHKCVRHDRLGQLEGGARRRLHARSHIGLRDRLDGALLHSPQLDGLVYAPQSVSNEKRERTVGGQQHVRVALALAPSNLIDLLLNLHALEVVKLGVVRLEFRVKFVLAALLLSRHTVTAAHAHLLVALEKNHAAAFVAGRQKVTRVVKFNGRDDIRYTVREPPGPDLIVPSVTSSTSPLSPKHCANFQLFSSWLALLDMVVMRVLKVRIGGGALTQQARRDKDLVKDGSTLGVVVSPSFRRHFYVGR